MHEGAGARTSTSRPTYYRWVVRLQPRHSLARCGMGLSPEELSRRVAEGGEHLSLPLCGLGDDGAALVASALGAAPDRTLRSLVVASNGISTEGVVLLTRSLGAMPVQKLDLSFNEAGDAGAIYVRALLGADSTLTYLDLEANRIGERGIAGIAESLATNTSLAHLNVSNNFVGPGGAAKIAEALRTNEVLDQLLLSSTSIGPEGAASLADALMDNKRLSVLSIGYCEIGDAGAKALAAAMVAFTGLRRLILPGNAIGPAGMVALFSAQGKSPVRTFEVNGNHLGDEGVDALASWFRRGNISLNLCDCGIGPRGLEVMADALELGESAFWYLLLDGNAGLAGLGDWSMEYQYPADCDQPEVLAARRVQKALLVTKAKTPHIPALIRDLTAETESFYRTLLQGRTRGLRRCKVAIVGSGRAGKTTLLARMTRQRFKEESASTRGISECKVDITTWRPGGGVQQGGLSAYHQAVAAELADEFRQQRTAFDDSLDQRTPAMIDELFEHFDQDGDGYLNQDEFKAVLQAAYNWGLGYQTDKGWTAENWVRYVSDARETSEDIVGLTAEDHDDIRGFRKAAFAEQVCGQTRAIAHYVGVQNLHDMVFGNFKVGGRSFKLGQKVSLQTDESNYGRNIRHLGQQRLAQLQATSGTLMCIDHTDHTGLVCLDGESFPLQREEGGVSVGCEATWVELLALETVGFLAVDKIPDQGCWPTKAPIKVAADVPATEPPSTKLDQRVVLAAVLAPPQADEPSTSPMRVDNSAELQRQFTKVNSGEAVFRDSEFVQVQEMVSRRMQNARTGEDDDPPTITCLDFAGQKMYEHMQHIFISDKLSIYVVVFSLAAPLDAMLPDEDESYAVTQKQNLLFWLNTVHAQAPSSPIMVVGTHADCVSEEQRQDIADELEEAFEGAAFERQLVFSDKGDRVVCVDNTSPVDEGLAGVRRLVDLESKQLPGYGDTVPMSWLRFLDRALELTKEEGRSFITLDEARDLAGANEIGAADDDDKELLLLLQLFTNLGLLMHFDTPALRNTIVLDTQWLLDIMCELLCLRSMNEKMQRAKSKVPEWRKLRRNGRLEGSLLSDIWPSLDEDQCLTMLEYMMKFGLVCALPSAEHEAKGYAVPALLPVCTDATSVWPAGGEDSDASASIFFIHSDGDWDESTGFLPQGVFFSLVAALLHDMDDIDAKSGLKHLYRDRICVRGSQLFMVVLKPDDHRIELTVRAEDPMGPASVAARITSLLSSGIADRYGVQYRLEVACTKCGALTWVGSPRCSECATMVDPKTWVLEKPEPEPEAVVAVMPSTGELYSADGSALLRRSSKSSAFASLRFDSTIPVEAEKLRVALEQSGVGLEIINMKGGGDIDKSVIDGIEHCDTFIVFGSAKYGEDTGNAACTYYESKFAQSQKKRVILIRMIPFDQEFEFPQARFLFGHNKLELPWILGTPMPVDLTAKIVEAMELGELQLAPVAALEEPEAHEADVATTQNPAARASTPPRAVTPPRQNAWSRMCMCLAPAAPPPLDGSAAGGSAGDSLVHLPWFKAFVSQTVKALEECFRHGAERVVVTGIKGDIQKGEFTLKEWPEMLSYVQKGVAASKVKGATWEKIEERRIDISNLDELVSIATGTTHVVIASCPGLHMDTVDRLCGTNHNVHLSFARAGDVTSLF